MNSSALAFIRAQSAEVADPTCAFATLTLIDCEADSNRSTRRYCLENLPPVDYERLAEEMQRLLREDCAQQRPAVTLNERAHVSVVVLDIDDGSPSEAAALRAAALVRSAFAVHFGVESAVYVAVRKAPSGALKYHIYLPDVLHIDDGVLNAVLKLARPNVQVDRKPSQARHLRMHGTDRRDDASGRFTGAGVYRVIGGYDKRGVPLARNYEPTVATDGACWHSVRAGERLVRHLLLDPHNAYPRAVTEAARQLMQIETPANTVSWACVLAAAGGDEAREVKLLLSASDGSWFVVSSQLPCDDCGERTEQRCLARLAAFEDGAGDQWLSVYRWTLCLGGCCTDRPVQSLAPLAVALSAAKASKAVSCQPRLCAHGANSFVSHDSLLNLPIEVVYPAGLGVVDAQTGRCQLAERRVSPQDALTATTVTTLTRQLIACLPGASDLAPGAVVESRLKLSVAACTMTDPATGRESTNLWNGLKDVEWTIPVGAHGIELWASPCGGGKTYAAVQRMMRLLAPGELLLLIAPRVVLTEQLAQRVDRTASESQHVWNGKVRTYKAVNANIMDNTLVVVSTLESLPRIASLASFAGVIIDEFCLDAHLLHGKTVANRRSAVLNALVQTIARARHTIVMDRDIAAGERLLVSHVVAQMQHSVRWERTNVREEIVRPPPVHVRHVTMADPVRRTVDLWTDVAQMCAHMQQQLLAGKNIAVFCATKEFAEKLCAALKPYFGDATVITGDTDADEKREFGIAPDKWFAKKSARIWIYTTAAAVGLSVDEEYFHEVYVIADDFLSLRALLQAEARVRVIIGQAPNTRRFHLCLPSSVRNRTKYVLQNTMPTVGTVIAAQEFAMRQTRAVDTALAAPDLDYSGLQVPAIDTDIAQLYQPTAVLLQTLATMESFECRMTRVIFEQWCVDANIEVITHEPPADPCLDSEVVAMRAVLSVGAKKRKAQVAVRAAVEGTDPKRSRSHVPGEHFAPAALESRALQVPDFATWVRTHASSHVHIWLASLVCNPALLSSTLLDGQRRSGTDAIAPLNSIALLGKLALQFLGISAVLRGEPVDAPALWRLDAGGGSALSPRDGRTALTLDEFFKHVARFGLIGSSPDALLPSVAGFSAHLRNLGRRNKNPIVSDRKRVKYLTRIVRCCYGDVEQPRRYMWSLAHWLTNQPDLLAVKQRLLDAPTLALLDEIAKTNPWGLPSQ
jgi:late competence protein required for DNA uptake (superfamily II DNA/RNA helicase)